MKTQSLGHGEFSHACLAGLIGRDDCIELGAVLAGTTAGRRAAEDITIADLTGVATQDIAMARTVLERATATQHGRS
jgi:ornithine cyclodeaminase